MRVRTLLLSASVLFPSCFVSEGDCVNQGVAVNPCFVSAKAGQTIVLRATVTGAPSEPIDWILPASAGSAFQATATDTTLTLISTQNVPGSFPIQASSRTDPLTYGGSVIGIASATFSSQAPPFVLFGGDLPVGSKVGATAVGGNLYYVAYAAASALVTGESAVQGSSLNFFVKQYSLATNALLVDVPGQFSLFTGTGAQTPIVPNVEADCQGNGYWIDAVGTGAPTYVLRKLQPGSSTPTEKTLGLFDSFAFRTLSVGCDGAIYFVADPLGGGFDPRLFRLASFDAPIVPVVTNPGFLPFFVDSMSIDLHGRLLIGDDNPDGTPGLQRLIVDPAAANGPVADVDPAFDTSLFSPVVSAVTSDAQGVVYAAVQFEGGPGVAAFNEVGGFVYGIGTYRLFCPAGCGDASCDTDVPFTSILSLDAAPDGALRIIDDPDTATLPVGCQEALRFLLIDPE